MFFVTEKALGFSERSNLLLAMAQGIAYTASALAAARLSRHLTRPRANGTQRSLRTILAIILALGGAVGLLPMFSHSAWAIWVFGIIYVGLAGFLWPTIEAYLSGGRRGAVLRRATGKFNLAWASSLVVGMWLIAPLLEAHAFLVLGGLILPHLLCVILLVWLPSSPAPAGHVDATAMLESESYGIERARTLLRSFRILLMASYTLHAALMPMLPHLLARLDVSVDWRTPIAATWMLSRFLLFLLFERWHGWHGRWRTAIWSGLFMLAGVAMCFTAPSLPMMFIGLTALGAGVGAVYAAALYYAMETGSADVDAGGRHEAMIGIGYTIGPIAALGIGAVIGMH